MFSSSSHPVLQDVGTEDTERIELGNCGVEIAFQKSVLKALFHLYPLQKCDNDPGSHKKGYSWTRTSPPKGLSSGELHEANFESPAEQQVTTQKLGDRPGKDGPLAEIPCLVAFPPAWGGWLSYLAADK